MPTGDASPQTMVPEGELLDSSKHRRGIHRELKYLVPTLSTAYRYCDVGGFSPTVEHTEFCTPLRPIAGNTVGVGATLMMSRTDCEEVIGRAM